VSQCCTAWVEYPKKTEPKKIQAKCGPPKRFTKFQPEWHSKRNVSWMSIL
jgi:hypothetical protein